MVVYGTGRYCSHGLFSGIVGDCDRELGFFRVIDARVGFGILWIDEVGARLPCFFVWIM